MTWIQFPTIAFISILIWLISSLFFVISKTKIRQTFSLIGIYLGATVLITFLIFFWIELDRPPMRTMGETRLWYSVFLSLIGIILFHVIKNKGLLIFNLFLASVFLLINVFKPEIHDKTLMPALQSPWFIPHVTVYMIAYATFGTALILFFIELYKKKRQGHIVDLNSIDRIVYIAYALLTTGILFGAFWANEAWGNYWAWDPKETWALLTWLGYISYIHIRKMHPKKIDAALTIMIISFIVLHICWFGISYLPSAGNSIHVYSGN